jgi:hypothetical protein
MQISFNGNQFPISLSSATAVEALKLCEGEVGGILNPGTDRFATN